MNPEISPKELQSMLDDMSLAPDLRASIKKLLAATLALLAQRLEQSPTPPDHEHTNH